MNESITHLKVPIKYEESTQCLGPEGSVANVLRVLKVISGRWTLPIFFRLCAEPIMRHSQFLKSMPEISHKVLTQHLRKLESDGLIYRTDFGEKPPRVEYGLTASGLALMPVLISMREFSRHHLDKSNDVNDIPELKFAFWQRMLTSRHDQRVSEPTWESSSSSMMFFIIRYISVEYDVVAGLACP